MTFKPMLSGKCEDVTKVTFPVLVSPKLDGVRALVINGVVVSRNMKAIPNRYVQELFGQCEGYDGELIVGAVNGESTFRDTTSGVMSRDGEPDVKFCVFDRWDKPDVVWQDRFRAVEEGNRVFKVSHHYVTMPEQITVLEEQYLAAGYEGVMIRSPLGPYKQGRSTWREGYLLKLKRFEDSEAWVVGMEEKMHNANEATINALGHTERSSHIANLKPMGVMGALIVRDCTTGVEFNIGTGFDDNDRQRWWDAYHEHGVTQMDTSGCSIVRFAQPVSMVKYKFFPSGSKDKPRFPTYLGIRDAQDL